MDVTLIRWPDELVRLASLRNEGAPRLLLVQADADPPSTVDELEDWIRIPAEDRDVRARASTLSARAAARLRPLVADDGLLRYKDQWIALSPVESAMARPLVDRFGAVVTRELVSRTAWPAGPPTRNALDVHMLRLRRRAELVGLEVRTVRARGYLLQASS
jgi:DNA-binding response OmpR family regulator